MNVFDIKVILFIFISVTFKTSLVLKKEKKCFVGWDMVLASMAYHAARIKEEEILKNLGIWKLESIGRETKAKMENSIIWDR